MKHTARFFTGQAVSAIILASLWNQPIDDQGWLDESFSFSSSILRAYTVPLD